MSEMQDMATILSLGVQSGAWMVMGATKGAIELIKWLTKLGHAGVLKGGEIEKLKDLLRATDGKVGLLNIPTEDPTLLQQIQEDFLSLKINYHRMPDLHTGDGQTQVMYAKKDEESIRHWYENFCTDRLLPGGRNTYERLMHLTGGQVEIVSVPLESRDMLSRMEIDFKKLHISYCLLPRLSVGEKKQHILYAKADAQKLREWYAVYQEELLKEKKEAAPPIKETSTEAYIQSAMIEMNEYIQTAEPETIAKIEQDARSSARKENKTVKKNTFKDARKQLCLQDAFYQKDVWEVRVSPKDLIGKDEHNCLIRILEGQDDYLMIPAALLYETKDGTYQAFLKKEVKYPVVDRAGNLKAGMEGREFYQIYDKIHWESPGKRGKSQVPTHLPKIR